jgi:hypothetical protein
MLTLIQYILELERVCSTTEQRGRVESASCTFCWRKGVANAVVLVCLRPPASSDLHGRVRLAPHLRGRAILAPTSQKTGSPLVRSGRPRTDTTPTRSARHLRPGPHGNLSSEPHRLETYGFRRGLDRGGRISGWSAAQPPRPEHVSLGTRPVACALCHVACVMGPASCGPTVEP